MLPTLLLDATATLLAGTAQPVYRMATEALLAATVGGQTETLGGARLPFSTAVFLTGIAAADFELLQQLGLNRPGRLALGGAVALGASLTLVPATFVGGSVLTAGSILLVLALQLHQHNLTGAATEVPFLVLALLVLYLRHPLA